MKYEHIRIPEGGARIAVHADGSLEVPSNPIIPYIEGDGIGIDITPVMRKVVDAAVQRAYGDRRRIAWMEVYAGEKANRVCGTWFPDESLHALREYVVSIKGPLGTPIGGGIHSLNVVMRQTLDLYACVRPIRHFPGVASPMQDASLTDMVVFRENTEGVYVSVGGRFKAGTEDEVAIQEEINTYKGVHRIIKHAFEFAQANGHTKVCMADKSNAMQQGHALWQRVFKEVAAQYPGITATHQYIDAMAMFMVKDPGQYQVIVTNNLFGDIITDIGGALQGGLGMAVSANMHPGKTSLFEPVHGSAPPLAGKNVANPIGAILSTALMLETLGAKDEAKAIEGAVEKAIAEHQVTSDIGGQLGTREAGDFIQKQVASSR